MSSETITVRFDGPMSWLGNDDTTCIFTADLGKKAGVYLWTVKSGNGELIYYVGSTGRSFSVRMLEHFKEHFSGGYHLYRPDTFVHGVKDMLWPGRYDRAGKTTAAEFARDFSTLAGPIEALARLYRFYVAPLECERRLAERIEAGIANHLYGQGGVIGDFQEVGIRYRARLDTEIAVLVYFETDAALLGMPAHLWV